MAFIGNAVVLLVEIPIVVSVLCASVIVNDWVVVVLDVGVIVSFSITLVIAFIALVVVLDKISLVEVVVAGAVVVCGF